MKQKVRLNVNVSPETLKAVKMASAKAAKSMGSFVEELVRKYVKVKE